MKSLELVGTRLLKGAPALYGTARRVVGIADALTLWASERRNAPLLIVYQQGRVASTSVYEALVRARPGMPVLHLHTLSAERAHALAAKHRQAGEPVPRNLVLSRKVAASLARRRRADAPAPRHKVVTIFRDPIAIMLSLKVMNPSPELTGLLSRDLRPEEATAFLQASLERDDPRGWAIGRWFDEVFAEEIGLDAYGAAFDHEAGFSVLRGGRHDVALLKFERLRRAFAPAMADLFGIDPAGLGLERTNIHRRTDLDTVHDHAKRNIRLSEGFCDLAYSTRFARHFYSEAERREFIRFWTSPRDTGSMHFP